MKTRGSGAAIGAAFFVTAAAITVGGTDIAAAVECSGPFKQCAIEIGAFCEIENGKLMIWYKDREGTSHRFEQCVGKVYEAHGRPNPYKPGAAQKPAPKR